MPKASNPEPAAMKQGDSPSRFVLVGPAKISLPPGFVACDASEVASKVFQARSKTIFVSNHRSGTEALLRAGLQSRRKTRAAQLLALEPPRPESVLSLLNVFPRVVGLGGGYAWLPLEELLTVLSGKERKNRFIGGAADPVAKTVALVRGDLTTVVAPFSFFKRSGDGTGPEFDKLAITDYGNTVRLGEYETSADGILYELDEDYRRRLRKQRLESDRSFGASLRRLRIQRGLRRGDFAPLSAKTVARIERDEVARPRGKSLGAIAARLRVDPDQIESF